MSILKLHHRILPAHISDNLKAVLGFLIYIAVLLVVIGIIVIPIVLHEVVFEKREPAFSVESASIHGFNLTTDGHLTAFYDITIRAHNRQHYFSLHYTRVRVSVFKDKQNLGEDMVDGFTQKKLSFSVLRVEPVSLNVKLKKNPAKDLSDEIGEGFVEFDVFMTALLGFDRKLEVNCKHVNVGIANIGASATTSSEATTRDFHRVDCHTKIRQCGTAHTRSCSIG